MLVKVKPNIQMDESCTWTSYFVRFLLKIWFFPIYIKGEIVRFSFFSWKTLAHLALNIGVLSSLYILGMYTSGFFEFFEFELSKVVLYKNKTNFTLVILSAILSGNCQHILGPTFSPSEYWPTFMFKGSSQHLK